MSKHTRGPWRVEADRDAGGFVIQGEDYEIAIVTPGDDDSESVGAAEKDATLIAAAPDLFSALSDLLDVINADALIPEAVSYMRRARAAIAKAVA